MMWVLVRRVFSVDLAEPQLQNVRRQMVSQPLSHNCSAARLSGCRSISAPLPRMPTTGSAPRSGSISRWRGSKEKNMSNNKGEKNGTQSEQPMKHAEPRDTALLSDILPLPEPRFHGRIGNTYVDS